MIIKKYTGKTEQEASDKAREDLGPGAVVMNVKKIVPKGIKKLWKRTSYEVTAAVEDDIPVATADKKTAAVPKPSSAATAQHASAPAPKTSVNTAINAYKDGAASSGGVSHTAVAGKGGGREAVKDDGSSNLEDRIDYLQQFLEKQFKSDDVSDSKASGGGDVSQENLKIIRMIYRTLIKNEVDERYVNQFTDEVQRATGNASGLDFILSNVYQKLILKFGEPDNIRVGSRKPKVVFFVGPTGVGKTTTIAKIASHFKVDMGMKIALATSDTYRIAATDQLQIYADILNIPMIVVYTADELNQTLDKFGDYDLILVDTAGFSHKNQSQKNELSDFIGGVDSRFEKDVYLVVSATTKYTDLLDIVDSYSEICNFSLIFTKLDETQCYGNLLNLRMHTGAELSYLTTGQNVPDDIEVFNAQKIVKQLLGGGN